MPRWQTRSIGKTRRYRVRAFNWLAKGGGFACRGSSLETFLAKRSRWPASSEHLGGFLSLLRDDLWLDGMKRLHRVGGEINERAGKHAQKQHPGDADVERYARRKRWFNG